MFEGYKLKTIRSFPPKGWLFRQPETGWETPRPLVDDFWKTVDLIVLHRKQNPRFTHLSRDEQQVADELEHYTVCRLKGGDQWCTASDVKKNVRESLGTVSRSQRLMQAAVAGVVGLVEDVKKNVDGAQILKDWLGAGGKPVAPDLAQGRAEICANCPNNVPGDWQTMITAFVAQTILDWRRVKTQMDIKVQGEERLGTCAVCLCHLPLKVHVPLKHILDYTSKETLGDFPSHCWIVREAYQP